MLSHSSYACCFIRLYCAFLVGVGLVIIQMVQAQSFNPNLQVILNCVQLGVWVVILGAGGYKLGRSIMHSREFLTKFYSCIILIACVEIGMQSYQLSQDANHAQPQTYILVIVNLYAMTCEAVAIFFLSDYWHETKEIITKTSTEIELKEEKHWLRHLLVVLWLALYTAFVAYALATGQLEGSESFQLVLTLGCQGIGGTILLWAILLQVMRGYHLATALGKYEEWLNRTSIKKMNFRCLYWMTSIFNFLRILFLISMSIVIEVYNKQVEWQWLAAYIYTASNCIVISVYILGFSTRPIDQTSKVSTLLEGEARRESHQSRSRHQTELSNSISDRSHQ